MTPSPWDRERAGVRVALIRPLILSALASPLEAGVSARIATLSPEGRGERRAK
jgi:hypothetical protein